jgi:glycosyltransferase involved in cell wall biosynthesis
MKRRGTPVIHSLHDLDPHSGTPLSVLLKAWNKLILRVSDQIVVHGQRYRNRLIEMGFSEERVIFMPLLHLFLRHSRIQELNHELGEVRYDRTVLFFGRIKKYKGVSTLLSAFNQYRQAGDGKIDFGFKLVIAGKGELPGELSGAALDGIEIMNQQVSDNVAEILFRECSLVVLPYHDATQSALIGAAYYFHKPVIVTRCGALPEYVLDGESGFVVPPNDATALAATFRMLSNNGRELARMGNRGRNWYDDQRKIESQILVNLYASR